jgi:hypothetical protein
MIATFGLVGLLLAGTGSPPVLQNLEGSPVEGRELILHLRDGGGPAGGVAVKVSYRQNAHRSLAHEQEIGTTGEDGTVRWTPMEAGVVVLSWEGGSENVSVIRSATPLTGVIVAIFAGILLLGGTGLSFYRMLTEGDVPPTDVHRAET